MRIIFFLFALLLATADFAFAQGGIQKTREATSKTCSENTAALAATYYHQGDNQTAEMTNKACSDAPVSLTRLVVLPDGFLIPYIKNLDSQRSVVGASYSITAFDAERKTKLEFKTVADLLEVYLKPGAEMRANSIKPFGPVKTAKQTIYLIELTSIRFDDGSEWHFDVECRLTKDLTTIRCKEINQ